MKSHDTQPVNIEDENEHFNLSDSIISWMENFKTLRNDCSKNSLATLLPPPQLSPSPSEAHSHHRSSAKGIAWNLVRIFGERQSSETLRKEFEDYTVQPTFDLSQENCSVFDLVSHILLEMNTKESLTNIQKSDPTNVSRFSERLANEITHHSTHLGGYKMHSSYFSSIATDDIPRLTNLILSRIEFINLEHSHNKLLNELLRCICIDIPNQGSLSETSTTQCETEFTIAERFERAVIYARFISDYLVELIKHLPVVVNCNKNYLSSLVNSSMQDLEPLLTSNELDTGQKMILYASLLKCCNCDILETDSRMLLARLVIESDLLRNRPQIVIQLVQALGQFMSDSKILVIMVEGCVDIYRNSDTQRLYEDVWTKFCLRLIPGELYLNACIQERAPLALLIHFESLFQLNRALSCDEISSLATNDSQQRREPPIRNKSIWSKLFLWLSRLNQSLSNLRGSDCLDASKLTFVWVRILVILEPQLGHYIMGCVGEQTDRTLDGQSGTHLHHEQDIFDDDSSETDQAKAGVLVTDDLKSSQTKAGNSRTIGQSNINAARINDGHKSLLTFIKQLISFYDSVNSGSLWSYLKSSNRNAHSSRVSVAALSVAFFIADRVLICITNTSGELQLYLSSLRDEMAKMRRISQAKLETARKSKSLLDCAQFVETLIGGTQHSDKVQYREVVELIRVYALAH